MNYEEKYKEALNKVKSRMENSVGGCLYECDIKEIFPELAESEDERIRKALLESFKYQQRESYPDKEWLSGIKLSDVVAWLEKQGEQKLSWGEEDEQFFNTALWHISNSVSNGKSADFHCGTTDWLKSLKDKINRNSGI